LQRPEGFRSLAELLREPREAPPDVHIEAPGAANVAGNDELAAAREMRLFMARAAEALECTIETLRNDAACEILGRELQLAPVDLRAIVARTIQRCALEAPARVRVHPGDLAALAGEFSVIADPELRRGDAVLEVRAGSIDASLGVRLDSVLRALR
jgi:flagellar biosynthesis/type III secretory pathway protein FliH